MTECKHELCQNEADSTCQRCRKTFCNKHVFTGSFTGPGSNRQVYGTYCFNCRQELENTQAFAPGSKFKSGAAWQIYILIGFFVVILAIIYLLFFKS